jgi:hypothetical protein
VFALQQQVGTQTIEALEREKVQRALSRLSAVPNIEILGGTGADRLSIVSLRFFHEGRELHHGFVVALLNDLFGIQARGGCSCAGPYGHALLGLSRTTSRALDEAVAAGESALRPGWVRLNFNYFIDEDEFEYLLGALALVAELGGHLLPSYRLDRCTGTWRHRKGAAALATSLSELDPLVSPAAQAAKPRPDFPGLLAEARALLQSGPEDDHLEACAGEARWSREHEALRWFLMGDEVLDARAESAA